VTRRWCCHGVMTRLQYDAPSKRPAAKLKLLEAPLGILKASTPRFADCGSDQAAHGARPGAPPSHKCRLCASGGAFECTDCIRFARPGEQTPAATFKAPPQSWAVGCETPIRLLNVSLTWWKASNRVSTEIQNKVIFITGGGTGIGAETALLLASKRARVAVAGRRRDKLGEVVDTIRAAGGTARAFMMDVVDKEQVAAGIAAAVAELGPIDVLINNAGIMPIRSMVEANTAEWDAMIDVNLKGVLYGIAAVLPDFMTRGRGHIINISSVAGTKVFSPGGVVYSGTKFAIRAISEGLRVEVGRSVRVTCIEPGMVESELKYNTTSDAAPHVLEAYKDALSARSVARAIAYAIEQPDDVDVNEIVIRPVSQQH
jgi:NADP-dependent 3-hydroxy acid dehydrogenase YdfG